MGIEFHLHQAVYLPKRQHPRRDTSKRSETRKMFLNSLHVVCSESQLAHRAEKHERLQRSDKIIIICILMTLVASNTLANPLTAFRASAKDKIYIKQINSAFLIPRLRECASPSTQLHFTSATWTVNNSTRHRGNKSLHFSTLSPNQIYLWEKLCFSRRRR